MAPQMSSGSNILVTSFVLSILIVLLAAEAGAANVDKPVCRKRSWSDGDHALHEALAKIVVAKRHKYGYKGTGAPKEGMVEDIIKEIARQTGKSEQEAAVSRPTTGAAPPPCGHPACPAQRPNNSNVLPQTLLQCLYKNHMKSKVGKDANKVGGWTQRAACLPTLSSSQSLTPSTGPSTQAAAAAYQAGPSHAGQQVRDTQQQHI